MTTAADTHAALAAATVDQLVDEIAVRLRLRPALVRKAIRQALIAGRAAESVTVHDTLEQT